jgi:hypothetical protein
MYSASDRLVALFWYIRRLPLLGSGFPLNLIFEGRKLFVRYREYSKIHA